MESHNEVQCSERFHYLIVHHDKGGILDLLKYSLWRDVPSAVKFMECRPSADELPEQHEDGKLATNHMWVVLATIIIRKIILLLRKPLECTGTLFESALNLFSNNGGFLGLIWNLVRGRMVAVPHKESENFMSAVGHLDWRTDLYEHDDPPNECGLSAREEGTLEVELLGNRALMVLCIMASKLVYENENFVRNVALGKWKMHSVDFIRCWNGQTACKNTHNLPSFDCQHKCTDCREKCSTHAFILCDKPVDANLILISFRGTNPFNAYDWCTDFNFSWYLIPDVGKVHMGFLEALGLGNRNSPETFRQYLNYGEAPPEDSAYYEVKTKLKSLLQEHKDAKFVVTGHSLGGALAILFPMLLLLHKETAVMRRLSGVYTFGQPRVGDHQLKNFMEDHFVHPDRKYFRVVYSYDLVPRLPSDDKIFFYKHIGVGLYYDSRYHVKEMEEEPNRNYFNPMYFIPMHMNAVWELIRGFTMGCTHGPEYREGWLSILSRLVGLVLPGVSAHLPMDYVNAMRLGKKVQFN